MKKGWMRMAAAGLALGLAWAAQTASAEPISFEQAANVTGLTGVQLGCELDYAYEKIEAEGVSAVENKIMDLPIFLRVGLPIMEIKLTMPYGSISDNTNAAKDSNFSGIRNVGVGIKSGLLALPVFNLALGLNTRFPTAEPAKYFFGEGLDLYPFLAADLDVIVLKVHGHVGYEYRGEYNRDFNPLTQDASASVKLKPGDATHYNLGIEIPASNMFFLMCELDGVKYGEVKIDGQGLPDSSGMTLSLVPGVRMQAGIVKMHAGVAIPLEKKDERPSFAPRSDWRVLAGASVLLGI